MEGGREKIGERKRGREREKEKEREREREREREKVLVNFYFHHTFQDVEKFTETLGELYSNILKVYTNMYMYRLTSSPENM